MGTAKSLISVIWTGGLSIYNNSTNSLLLRDLYYILNKQVRIIIIIIFIIIIIIIGYLYIIILPTHYCYATYTTYWINKFALLLLLFLLLLFYFIIIYFIIIILFFDISIVIIRHFDIIIIIFNFRQCNLRWSATFICKANSELFISLRTRHRHPKNINHRHFRINSVSRNQCCVITNTQTKPNIKI